MGEEEIDFLLKEIELNELVLPEFQREFVWSKEQARELVKSLYRDLRNKRARICSKAVEAEKIESKILTEH